MQPEGLDELDGSDEDSAGAAGPPPPVPGRGYVGRAIGGVLSIGQRQLGRYALVIALVLAAAVFSVLQPGTFLTVGNLTSLLSSQAAILILALAVTLPLRVGEFDLSVAAVMGFTAAVAGLLALHGVPIPIACAAALLAGLVVGATNALLVVVVGINAFIATLGTMTIVGGLAYLITGGNVLGDLPGGLLEISRTNVVGLPLGVVYGWVLAAFFWYLYERTPFGRYLLFIGGNVDASRLAGIRVERVRIVVFVASAITAAFAGIILVSSLGAIDPSIGNQYLLPPYAAAFLGTTAIQVGRFNVVGTLIGMYLLAIGITGLELLAVAPWIADVFDGGALVAAIAFATLASRRGLI